MKFTEKQIEQIARKFCELKGLDPDEHITEKNHTPLGVENLDMCVSSARWTQVVYEVKQFLALQQAVRFVEQAEA